MSFIPLIYYLNVQWSRLKKGNLSNGFDVIVLIFSERVFNNDAIVFMLIKNYAN